MLETLFRQHAAKLLPFIEDRLPNATYVSALLFKEGRLLASINNNYNNWRDHYTLKDMKHDDVFKVFFEKIKRNNKSICFWNSVPHESEESVKIDQKRTQYGLYNGVTILEAVNSTYTLGINITSNNHIDEDLFYSKVILKRKLFMKTLRSFLQP